jgi:hypothetical protein
MTTTALCSHTFSKTQVQVSAELGLVDAPMRDLDRPISVAPFALRAHAAAFDGLFGSPMQACKPHTPEPRYDPGCC